jgi:hypothetical protein
MAIILDLAGFDVRVERTRRRSELHYAQAR